MLEEKRLWVRFPIISLNSVTYLILPTAAPWPRGLLSFKQNGHLSVDCSDNVGSSTSNISIGLHGLMQGYLVRFRWNDISFEIFTVTRTKVVVILAMIAYVMVSALLRFCRIQADCFHFWRCRQYVPPKRWYPPRIAHGIITHATSISEIFMYIMRQIISCGVYVEEYFHTCAPPRTASVV